MPELGSATFTLEVDASEFDRDLALAKAEAAAAARDINRSLDSIEMPHLAPLVIGTTGGTGRDRFGLQGLIQGFRDLRTASNADMGLGLNTLLGLQRQLQGAIGDTSQAVTNLDNQIQGLQNRLQQQGGLDLIDVSAAETNLATMTRMLDRFYRDSKQRVIAMDRELSRQFGLPGGGTRDGLLARMLNVTYAAPGGGPMGFGMTEQALTTALTAAVQAGMRQSRGGARTSAEAVQLTQQSDSNLASMLARDLAPLLNLGGGSPSEPSRVFVSPPSGPAAVMPGGPGSETTVRISPAQYGGLITALTGLRIPTSGGPGASVAPPPVAVTPPTPSITPPSDAPPPADQRPAIPWSRALWGTGAFGLAGLGTLGSFAGFGLEHVITVVLGLVGSLASALGGLGAIALGTFGKMAVGMGSDALAFRTTYNNVKSVYQAQQAYNQAVATYGKNSLQATQAQQQMNAAIQQVPAGARAATVATANMYSQMKSFWQNASVPAQNQANAIFQQLIGLANRYVPLIANAAQRNLTIINNSIKPLLTWLKGPDGVGIFTTLENSFANTLPTAIHLFSQSVELILRVMGIASQYTGTFVSHLNNLVTGLNNMDNFQLQSVIQRLVNDFHLWDNFVKILIIDIADLFRNAQGTGSSIIQTLTTMLQHLHTWEQSLQGQVMLSNVFTTSKAMIDALLQVLPLLVNAFAPIYLTVAPALKAVLTPVLTVIEHIISAIESFPAGAWVLGLGLIAAKLGLLIPLLTRVGMAMKLINTQSKVSSFGQLGSALLTGGTPAAAAANVEKAVATEASAAAPGGLMGILMNKWGTQINTAKSAMQKGFSSIFSAIGPGLGGIFAGQLIGGFIPGLKHDMVSSLGVGAIGGLLGSIFGPWGTFIGSTIGSTLGPTLVSEIQKFLGNPPANPNLPLSNPSTQRTIKALQGTGPPISPPGVLMKASDFPGITTALQSWVSQMQHMRSVAQLTAGQLKAMTTEGHNFQALFSGTAVANIIDHYMTPLNKYMQGLSGTFRLMTQRWNADSKAGLSQLVGTFQANMLLISNTLSLNSAHGRQAMTQNLQQLVNNISAQMAKGKINVTRGMNAIAAAMQQTAKHGVLGTQAEFQTMFHVLQTLWQKGKIPPQQYFSWLMRISAQDTKSTTQGALTQWTNYQRLLGQRLSTGRLEITKYLQAVQSDFKTYTGQTVINTTQGYQSMFQALSQARLQDKISESTYQKDVAQIYQQGKTQIVQQVQAAANQQITILKQQAAQNPQYAKQLWAQIHQIQQQAGQQAHQDMTAWAGQVYSGMKGAAGTSGTGAAAIAKELNNLLRSLHASPIPVPTTITLPPPSINPYTGTGLGAHAAGGGLFQIGQPGSGGKDTVPMMVGNQPYMVAEGETVAVFNRHQMPVVDAALAPIGGLSGLFDSIQRPNYMATGGYVYPFAPGVPIGRTDQGIDPTAPAGAPFGPIGTGTVIETSGSGWPGGPFMSWILDSGPYAGHYVYLAEMIRPTVSPGQRITSPTQTIAVSTGPSQEMGWAGNGGTTTLSQAMGLTQTQYPGWSNTPQGLQFRAFIAGLSHGQLTAPGPGLGLPPLPTLKPPMAGGPPGPWKTAVQAMLNKGTSAANTYAQAKYAALTPAVSPGGSPGSLGSPPPGALAIMQSLARQHGWTAPGLIQDWLNVIGVEDGSWSLTAKNPTSPAYGLAQFINGPSEYYQYGGNPNTLLGQLTAMANYIAQRYGTPAGAWAHEQQYHSYGLGGLIMAAAGLDPHDRGKKKHKHRPPPKKDHKHKPLIPEAWMDHINSWSQTADWIHEQTPQFPIKDLGGHWFEWLVDNMTFKPLQPSDITQNYMKSFTGWVGETMNTTVPRIQEKEQQLSSMWQNPSKGQNKKLINLDQEAVAWLLRIVHDIKRTLPALKAKIGSLKGSAQAPFKKFESTLNSDLKNLIGLSGIGGTLGQAEVSLMGLFQQQQGGGQNTQQLLSLMQQQNQILRNKLFIEKSQLSALTESLLQLPPYAAGTPYVPRTGPAMVHAGEAIIPAEMNPFAGNGPPTVQPKMELHIHGGVGALVDQVEVVVNGKRREITDWVNHDLANASRNSRLLPGGSPVTQGGVGLRTRGPGG